MSPTFRWEQAGGLVQGADKCTGSADCRKSSLIGGVMCPSFMATRNERDSTRARANLLREYMTGNGGLESPMIEQVKDVLDLCLMCKACKAECPSNIDVAKLKAEFLNHYRQKKGSTLRDRLFAHQPVIFRKMLGIRSIYNTMMSSSIVGKWTKQLLRITPDLALPRINAVTIEEWHRNQTQLPTSTKRVYLMADEFNNYSDSSVGISAIRLLDALGYEVVIPKVNNSGRTYLSKGYLDKARKLAHQNIAQLKDIITAGTPFVGLEPSSILTFRDEYPELVEGPFRGDANRIAAFTFTIEEFLWREMEAGRIRREAFTSAEKQVLYHGHCYQKTLSDSDITRKILEFPANYKATEVKSGCCGMAGAFGYEKEHAALSRQIGEMKLFPAVRQATAQTVIAASGFSCRHHIAQNTGRDCVHPVVVLWEALEGQ